MRRFFVLIVTAIGLGSLFWPATEASSCPTSTYTYKRSIVEVRDCNGNLTITYKQPRQDLVDFGVGNGTLLFNGTEQAGGAISGHARTFVALGGAKCGEITYPATGSRQGNTIKLAGNVPARNSSCKVVRHEANEMVFTAQAAVAPTCPQGYVLSGNQCVAGAPKPSCPAGYTLSGGNCVQGATAQPPIRRAPPIRTAPTVNLALELQTQLKRIGCLTGRVDGVWGGGSRAALARFANQAGLRLGSEPSQQAIDEAARTEAGYCQPVRAAPSRPSHVASTSDWDDLGCSDLWYERNSYFAQNGRCFTTARGKKAFHNNPDYPNVCKPPYGKLSASEKADVAAIQQVERRKGCR